MDEQINGKLPLRSLMDQAVKNNSDKLGPVINPFINAIELSRQYIKTSNQSGYSLKMFDRSDSVTAQYLRAHSDVRG